MLNKYELYEVAQKAYGDTEVILAIEEMAELTKTLTKLLRDPTMDKDDIEEEFADVEIMLEQMKSYLNLNPNNIEEVKAYKLVRLENQLRKEGWIE